MCGILVNNASNEGFSDALNLLKHRGPDASGMIELASHSIGHHRLSILDLDSQSDQPFRSDDGNLAMSYNGEIYNFKELASKHGLVCRTSSDSEVLLRLYEKLGAKCLDELNGMFAFVVIHRGSGKVFAARDRLGIKPLYLDRRSKQVRFCSEVEPLLKLDPDFSWDYEGLRQYVKLRTCFHGKTVYKNIEMLPAGHYYDDGNVRCYWNLPEGEQRAPEDDELRELLEDAIKIRRLSDVPVGSYLSGGLDSTIVAGVAKVNDVWSVGFEDHNEFEYADLAASKFGLSHTACLMNAEGFLSTAKEMIVKRREPLSVPNEVLIYEMTKQVKAKNTVVLSGEGADELFFGYDRVFRWAEQQSSFQLGEFDKLYSYGSHKDDEIFESVMEPYLGGRTALDSVARFFQLDHLQGLLRRLDNSTMLASVEARVPFVDHRLVERMAGVSFDYRMEAGVVKAPLKRVFNDLVPQEIIHRKKVGFPVPLAQIFGDRDSDKKTFMDKWLQFNVETFSGDKTLYEEIINSIDN